MPSERFVAELNAQIAREFAAAHQYTAIAAWYAAETYPRLAGFFYEQADEERGHALKMVDYLLDTGEEVDFGAIDKPRGDFDDHVAPIRPRSRRSSRSRSTSRKLFEVARETNDYRSEQFVHWFLEEQTEEEASMRDLLAVAERTRDVPMLLEEYLARDTPGERKD